MKTDLQPFLRVAVKEASDAEKRHDLDARNLAAQRIFDVKAYRKFSIGKDTVETWYDRQSQNYITEVLKDGNPVVDAEYTGHKNDAAVAHFWALRTTFFPHEALPKTSISRYNFWEKDRIVAPLKEAIDARKRSFIASSGAERDFWRREMRFKSRDAVHECRKFVLSTSV